MEQLRKLIRKTLLKEHIIKENLDYVRKYISDSDFVKKAAESWADEINSKGDGIFFSFANDSLDFKKTSYMLEILMYAIAMQKDGKFTLPTIGKTISVNPEKIAKGIMIYLFPSHDLQRFASFISGGGFSITANELEQLDVLDALGKVQNVLSNMPKYITGYLSNDYFSNPSKSFVNYIQTAIRFPLRDLRKLADKRGMSSLDEPMGDGNKSRSDMVSGEEKDSYNDYSFLDVVDDDSPYSPEVGAEISKILKLNYDIYDALRKRKDIYGQFFYYKVIGEGGDSNTFGKTYNHAGLLQKFLNDKNFPTEFSEDIKKRIATQAKSFFEKNSELFEKFKKENKNSFDENGNLIVAKPLVEFMLNNAKGTKFSPLVVFKRIRRGIQDLFDTEKKQIPLNQLINYYKLINPKTNQIFDGFEYLNSLLKAKTASKNEIPSSQPVPAEVNEILKEDLIYEELVHEGEDDEKLSFSDIFKIAKASSEAKKIK